MKSSADHIEAAVEMNNEPDENEIDLEELLGEKLFAELVEIAKAKNKPLDQYCIEIIQEDIAAHKRLRRLGIKPLPIEEDDDLS